MLELLRRGLTEEGHNVTCASDGNEGWELAHAYEFDAVVLDVMLPKMNGFEMVFEMKKQDNNLQVIFLTGYVDLMKEVNKLFTKLNVLEVIQKPIGISQLVERINTLQVGMKPKMEKPE